MSGLHGVLGQLTVVLSVVVAMIALAASVLLARGPGRLLARTTDVLAVVVAVIVAVTLFVGGLLLITGLRPASPLHMLLAVAALAAMPVATGAGRWLEQGAGRSPGRYRWLAGGAVVTTILGLLLAFSG